MGSKILDDETEVIENVLVNEVGSSFDSVICSWIHQVLTWFIAEQRGQASTIANSIRLHVFNSTKYFSHY